MTTFDLAEVRSFAVDLFTRMDRCDNGEGLQCATIDATLRHYAALCCEFREQVRQWGRAVFGGGVAFDSQVERLWFDEGTRLLRRALAILGYGQKAELPCYALEGQAILQSALWDLGQLLNRWVTPKLAVGPSDRQGLPLDPATAEETRRRIESLPPLPSDWQPQDPVQKKVFQKICKQ